MDNHYVYCITNLINNKKYIGKRTCHCDIDQDSYMGSGIAIIKAIKKYGKDSFKKEILAVCANEADAYQKEREIIEFTKAYSDRMYYNIAFGGLGNTHDWHPTQEAIKKGLETKKKNGTEPIGEKNGMYGKYNYEKRCRKIVCIPISGETITFPSLAEAGRYFNCYYKRISQGCERGSAVSIDNTYYYFIFYDDFKKIINKSKYIKDKQKYLKEYSIKNKKTYFFYNQREVYQIDVESLDIIEKFNSIYSIVEQTGIPASSISRCVKHGANCARKGFSYIFADEYEQLNKDIIYELYHRKKYISKPHLTTRKSVYCVTTDQVFNSVQEAINYFNIAKGTKIASVCKGERQFAGRHPVSNEPLVWQYYNDYLNGEYSFYTPKEEKYRNKDVDVIVSFYIQKLNKNT